MLDCIDLILLYWFVIMVWLDCWCLRCLFDLVWFVVLICLWLVCVCCVVVDWLRC